MNNTMKSKFLNYIKNIFCIICPVCKRGKLSYNFSEKLNIYECNNCSVELI